jgi:hypothetical protein
MKRLSITYPWSKVEKGQGFFVPCLDFEKMREYGLTKAVSERILDARAIPGIKDGAAGVWFFRQPLGKSRPS